MDVLHVMKMTGIGGAERHLLGLLPRLRASGWDARLCILTERPSPDLASAFASRGIPTMSLTLRADLDPVLLTRLARTLREVSIVHTHMVHADVHVGLVRRLTRRPRTRSVLTVHSERIEESRLARLLVRHAARDVDACIATSRTTCNVAREMLGIPVERIELIPLGIEAPEVAWCSHPRDGEMRIVTHGRLVAGKRVDVLLRALALSDVGDAALTVVGDGRERSMLERLASDLGVADAVSFVGFQPDPWPLLAEASVWIGTSINEGFSLALAEALTSGLAVVCSDIPAHREVAGDCALFVPAGDVEATAAALERLAANPELRADLSRRSLRRSGRFSVERMTDAMVHLYARIARTVPTP